VELRQDADDIQLVQLARSGTEWKAVPLTFEITGPFGAR
jgi:hypothetical protein